MSRLDFISLNVRGYSTLLSLPLADLNVYKQKTPLMGGAKYHPSDYETYEYSSILLDWMAM